MCRGVPSFSPEIFKELINTLHTQKQTIPKVYRITSNLEPPNFVKVSQIVYRCSTHNAEFGSGAAFGFYKVQPRLPAAYI